jgi:hypothetical protein
MAQERLWYAVQSVSFARLGSTTYTAAHGVQSCSVSTRFNLQEIFEFGQSDLYEYVERQPDVELSVEKVLDGYPLLWHLATNGALAGSLAGRANQRCMIGVSLYTDTQDSASGTPIKQLICSGMYPTQISFDFPSEGPAKEMMQFIGNDKTWGVGLFSAPTFDNTDSPLALASSGGVQFRENLIIGEASGGVSKFPTVIEGVTASGTIQVVQGVPSVYMQSAKINVPLNRQPIYSLGKKGACFRYIQFPVKIDATFEVHSKQGDGITVYEEANTLTNETIYIAMQEGTRISLGNKCKLENTSTNLGPAQSNGGAATTSYAMSSYSICTISHPQDPSGL